jgi:uncharacterized protein YkwD
MKSLVVIFVAASLSVFAQQSEFHKYTGGVRIDSFPMTKEYYAIWKQDSIKYNHLINSDSIEYYLLQHFNTLRKSYNLKPLSLYKNDSAYIKCNNWLNYLLDNKKIGHNGEESEIACGYHIIRSEYSTNVRNINKFIAYQLYVLWINSPNHKSIITNPDYKFMISCTSTRFSYAMPYFSKRLTSLARFYR